MDRSPHRQRGPLTLARGARRAEEAVLDRLETLAEEARATPELLATPVVVVVPSASLAQHLSAAWMRRRGRAAAGVSIQTLFRLAAGVLERAGEPAPRGGLALEVFVRRSAARQRRLAAALGGVRDGFGAVVATVRDLLDAGFTAHHLGAVEDQLAALGAGGSHPGHAALAQEIARVAAASWALMQEQGLGRPGDVYARAAERLALAPGLLPARAVLVHGFANATGLALDLLEVLAGKLGAEVVLDLPPDLSAVGGAAAGLSFASRLAWRLGGLDLEAAGVVSDCSGRAPARPIPEDGRAGARPLQAEGEAAPAPGWVPQLRVVAAPGAHAEARSVALAARGLLRAGAIPESIGIVARDLAPYRLPLRRALSRLGVPFSAPTAEAAPDAVERRLAALLDLLALGRRAPADRWLAALEGTAPPELGSLLDLRVGLRSLGAARLVDVAELSPGEHLVRGALPLPLRLGAEEPDDEERDETAGDPPSPTRLERRQLAGEALAAAVAAARRLASQLENRPRQAALEGQVAWLRDLLAVPLGWPEADPARRRVAAALAALAGELPAGFPLAADELPLVLRRAIEATARRPLGGAGGGVQVLDATAARGRTFDNLFLVGVNRDLLPRKVVEDPLLPDALRRALRSVLPDLPVKDEGHAEERYLFAQLLSSAERVTLSYRETDDDGEPQAPSPLLERLRLAEVPRQESTAAHPHDVSGAPASRPLPADDEAVAAALAAGRAGLGSLLPTALAAAGRPRPEDLARVRLAALDELDPDLSTPEGWRRAARPGPFLGWVGPRAPGPREEAGEIFVTELERLSACGWQTLLERGLRLEPAPDPLASLATLDGLLVGEVVHAVVERWVRQAGGRAGGSLAEALAAPPVAGAWPAEAALEALAQGVAAQVARRRGVPLLARPLARRALVFLAAAARGGLAEPGLVLGAELEGAAMVSDAAGKPHRVRFRADLAQAGPTGVVLTDLKVGKPLSEAKREAKRREHLLGAVANGRRLQAAAYALAEEGGTEGVSGRYLFLGRPEEEGIARELTLAAGDPEARALFAQAVATLAAARERGAFLPRLLDDKLEEEGPACRFCAVLEACAQRDSGATRRLARWVEAEREKGAGAAGTVAAEAFALFQLHARQRGAAGGEE